ncbi:MAG TPA: FecR domain-containing protein [Burkholderiales bacterium]|nr:FecR domain-containing protein [Burkholderiales bacterium]
MRTRSGFRLTQRATLALLVSAAFSAPVHAEVARVDFAIGGVTATGADGKQRALVKGSVLETGETVTTSPNGRAQLRFTDGGYTSLQPDTEFRIDDYRYAGVTDGLEKGFFSLLKGGLRTITGAIGRNNKSTYQVNTTTATIGIRGTEYLARVTNSLELAVGDGAAEVRTRESQPRTFLIPEFSAISLSSPTATPSFTQPPILAPKPAETPAKQGSQPVTPPGQSDSQQTTSATPPPPPPAVNVGSEVNANGVAAIIGGGGGFGLPHGSGYALAFAIGGEGNFCQIGCVNSGSGSQCGRPDVTFNGSSVSFTQGSYFSGDFIAAGSQSIAQGTTSLQAFSIGNMAAIGVFTNGTLATSGSTASPNGITLGPGEGAHFFLFIPTPAMPTTGTATYSMVAATTPTFTNGIGGGGLSPGGVVNSSSMTVTFGPSTPFLSGASNYTFPGGTYQLSYSATISGAGFSGGGSFSRTSGTGSACVSSCSAQLYGGFSGAATGSPAAPPYAGYVTKIFAPGFQVNNAVLLQR